MEKVHKNDTSNNKPSSKSFSKYLGFSLTAKIPVPFMEGGGGGGHGSFCTSPRSVALSGSAGHVYGA
jgi:hypothetical protein